MELNAGVWHFVDCLLSVVQLAIAALSTAHCMAVAHC